MLGFQSTVPDPHDYYCFVLIYQTGLTTNITLNGREYTIG